MLFKDNKYTKWYFTLIENCKNKNYKSYTEKHHIIPKSLGGSDKLSNIIILSFREHYIAHLLLMKMCDGESKKKMVWAFHRMSFSNNDKIPKNSHQYELARKYFSTFMKDKNNHPSKTSSEWSKNASESIKKNWKNDDERRLKNSMTMKKTQERLKKENPDLYYKTQKENAKKGAQRMKELALFDIEFYGEIYKGWNDLLEKTQITPTLYKKFYENGINPTFRIGKNGPLSKKEIIDISQELNMTYEETYEYLKNKKIINRKEVSYD
jgi:hypothetical protein